LLTVKVKAVYISLRHKKLGATWMVAPRLGRFLIVGWMKPRPFVIGARLFPI
jgi:hypothetical protein